MKGMESTEKIQEKSKESKKSWFSDIPIYLIVLLLVLGMVGSYAVSLLLAPAQTPTPINTGDDKIVKIELVYSEDCGFCRKGNTITDLFDFKGIPYKTEEIEAGTPRGRQLIADFGIKSLPTALVNEKELNFYTTEKKAMDESFITKDGKYIVPEVNLDQEKVYAKMYLDKTGCVADTNSGKVAVDFFDDPYSETSIIQTNKINQALADVNDSVELRYRYVEGRSNSLPDDVPFELESMAATYLYCAAEQGKFTELNQAIKGMYCNHIGIEFDATQEEIDTCNLSKHYGIFLSKIDLDGASRRVGLDMNALAACKPIAENSFSEAARNALAFKVTRIPTAIIACTYNVPIEQIKDAACKVDKSACS